MKKRKAKAKPKRKVSKKVQACVQRGINAKRKKGIPINAQAFAILYSECGEPRKRKK